MDKAGIGREMVSGRDDDGGAVQMILLSGEQGLKMPHIAAVVRDIGVTQGRWRERHAAESTEGLQDAPRPGHLSEITTDIEPW